MNEGKNFAPHVRDVPLEHVLIVNPVHVTEHDAEKNPNRVPVVVVIHVMYAKRRATPKPHVILVLPTVTLASVEP